MSSTERTDHAAEARTLLISADGDVSMNWPAMTGEYKSDVLAAAQVHATLALAEQQKIANLIALASMAEDDSKHDVIAGMLGNEAVWTLATTKLIEPDNDIEIINPDIAAALGIEQP